VILRRYLQTLGYRVCGWGLGFNRGDVHGILPRVADAVKRCADHAGDRVRLVGWSLGGVIAREIARDDPDLVERIITMGSPVCGGFKYTSGHWWYRLCRYDLDKMAAEAEERNQRRLRIPVTAIYAAWDGIVWRRACFDKWSNIEHVEVATTHIGLGMNPEVYRIIAQRFAVPTARRHRASTRAEVVREIGPCAMRKAS
jgi:pimeloyl-ACP methyl ester carboxylesterase